MQKKQSRADLLISGTMNHETQQSDSKPFNKCGSHELMRRFLSVEHGLNSIHCLEASHRLERHRKRHDKKEYIESMAADHIPVVPHSDDSVSSSSLDEDIT